MAANISFGDSLTENALVSKLPRKIRKGYKKLDVHTRQNFIDLFNIDEHKALNDIKDLLGHEKTEKELKLDKEREHAIERDNIKTSNYLYEQGVANPTDITLNAFDRQNIRANSDKFFNTFGGLTLDFHKQLEANYYNTQIKQNLVNMAQTDEIIKQNDTLIEQNEEIIDLLRAIASK